MSNLISQIENLKKSPIKEVVDKRIKEFESFGKKKQDEVFSELCFCLLTANFQAEKCIQIQIEMSRDFEIISKEELAKKLKAVGHRFWPQRAERIVEARECKTELCSLVKSARTGVSSDEQKMREWLVKTVKGLGMKESSHFLRNVGYKNLAIIDFHIVDLLERENLIEKPKTITPKKYLEIEQVLANLGKKVNLNLAELDLYLWYLETGKILK